MGPAPRVMLSVATLSGMGADWSLFQHQPQARHVEKRGKPSCMSGGFPLSRMLFQSAKVPAISGQRMAWRGTGGSPFRAGGSKPTLGSP